MSGLLVYALHHEGAFNKSSLGAISEGARLAARLGAACDAVVVGDREELTDELCAGLGTYGARRVFRAEGPAGLAQPVVDAMDNLAGEHGHAGALFGGGLIGFEAGAGLAARLDAGLCVEATGIGVHDGALVAERPVLGDSQVATVSFRSAFAVIVGRLNAFEARAGDGGPAAVRDFTIRYRPHSLRATMVQRGGRRGAETHLEDAEVVVAGGRGLGRPEGFRELEELAGALGGAVAATRAVVDAGWYPYAAQVGQTGKTVAPRLYLAAGISGAIQHKVGMQGAENIMAINKDAHAPIFEFAHLGVVGDLHRIVPRLTAAIRARGSD